MPGSTETTRCPLCAYKHVRGGIVSKIECEIAKSVRQKWIATSRARNASATRCSLCNYVHWGAEDPKRCERVERHKQQARGSTHACSDCGYTHYRPNNEKGCMAAAAQRAKKNAARRRKTKRGAKEPAEKEASTPQTEDPSCAECGGKHGSRGCPSAHPLKKRRLRRAVNAVVRRSARSSKARETSTQSEAGSGSGSAGSADKAQK